MSSILKALARSNSSDDVLGRVLIESAGIWENCSMLVPVLNGYPINEGDIVLVYVSSGDYANPIVLGRSIDKGFPTNGNIPDGFSILWESVSGGVWSLAYVGGDRIVIDTSSGTSISVSGGDVQFHDGSNGGLVNVSSLRSALQAIQKDLVVASSGANLAEWLVTGLTEIEDTTVTH